jgi:hypothetical protein
MEAIMRNNHLSLFAGIGGASEAIRQSGLSCRTVGFSEINKITEKMYRALHGNEAVSLGDITSISMGTLHRLGKIDLLTAGFPCQSFSRMGKGLGWECDTLKTVVRSMLGVIMATKPRYILVENVLAITQHPHHLGWQKFLKTMGDMGYNNFVHRGNPLDMGYLQSRSRVYVAFSRHDQEYWSFPPLEKIEKQQFTVDPMASTLSNCYKINPNRAVKIYGETDSSFACVTALAADSHCRRATWIRHVDGQARAWTLDELYQLFGWWRHPNIPITPRGISRATMYRGFGNSWHVGHASRVLETCPLEKVGDPLENSNEVSHG